MFTLNGRPLRPGDLEKALREAAVESVRAQLRERLEAIRLPQTGEFPTVIVEGDSLTDLSVRIEGSSELIEHVKSRLSAEDLAGITFASRSKVSTPRAFLSYGSEDRVLAQVIAETFMKSGIETWWDAWEIRSGDSLRQKIDAGLMECTHFIVLLTPTSIAKPWMNQEMDAGLVRRLEQQCTFIPLRNKLPASKLPPLLSGMRSPEVADDASDLQPLIHDIFDISRKPALGTPPVIVRRPTSDFSLAATAVAEVFVKKATYGLFGEVQFNPQELAERTGLSQDDVVDALHELRAFFLEGGGQCLARPTLYATFDRYFMDFDPAQDALRLAADLVNDPEFPANPRAIAERYGWAPRRLNPAIAYLMQREVVRGLDALDCVPFVVVQLVRTDATRRFVKSRT